MTYDKKTWQATEASGLREQIQPIVNRLPPIEYHSRSNGEIDYYGASFCISNLLGLSRPLFSRSTWAHFWTWLDIMFPEELVDMGKKDANNLVPLKSHELLLNRHGFNNAIAVGVPFLYSNLVDVPRIPDSLLVFPMHTTQCTTLTIHDEAHAYVEYIKQLRGQFSLVVASIGYEDVRRGNWIP
ncbi:MAG: hypothetical protein GYA47_04370, partial [Desulfovibrio sp.]|nr:hypothetical protein [Desulfovibrio sp.]